MYFNIDDGCGKIRGVYMQGNTQAAPIFRQWLQPFASIDATGITMSSTGSTDHLSFDAVGIPAFQFIQDELDYEARTHHSNMDVYDHLFQYLSSQNSFSYNESALVLTLSDKTKTD